MDEVIRHALVRQPEAIEWTEVLPPVPVARDEDAAGVVAH
jgi:ATP-dependent Lon protease